MYDSVSTGGQSGWFEIGGTSVGAPSWSSLIATADQGRVIDTLGTLSNGQATLYTLSAASYHDITSGSNGGYSAGAGYDAVTGLGSPVASSVIYELATGTAGNGSPESSSYGLSGSTGGGGGGGGHHHYNGSFGGRGFAIVSTSGADLNPAFQIASSGNTLATNTADAITSPAPATLAPLLVNVQSTTYTFRAGGSVGDTATDSAASAVQLANGDDQSSLPTSDTGANQTPATPADTFDDVDVPTVTDRAAIEQMVARLRHVELTPAAVDQYLCRRGRTQQPRSIRIASSSRAAAAVAIRPRARRLGGRVSGARCHAAKSERLDAPRHSSPLVPSPQLTAPQRMCPAAHRFARHE